MAAFNWILLDATCPACRESARIRCQTHVASDFGGDASGRFCDREYRLGDRMVWWPRDDHGFNEWHAYVPVDADFDEEACYSTCERCGAHLCAVVRFHDTVVEALVALSLEEDWPDGYAR